MRKPLILFGLLLLVLTAVMAADCIKKQELVQNRLQARYNFYYYRSEVRQIEMTAVLDHGDDLGKDTAELESIKDQFVATYETAQTASDAGDSGAFNAAVSDGKILVRQFREAARAMFNESERGGVRAVMNSSSQANEGYFDGLKQDAIGSGKDHRLTSFDARICAFQNFIDRSEEKGIDMSTYQTSLDELALKRDALASALDAANEACSKPVFACNETQAETFRELRAELNKEFVDLKKDMNAARSKQGVSKKLEQVDRRIERMDSWLDKMEEKGQNVSEYRTSLEAVSSLLEEALVLLEAGDNDAALEKVNQAVEDLNDFMSELKSQKANSKDNGDGNDGDKGGNSSKGGGKK